LFGVELGSVGSVPNGAFNNNNNNNKQATLQLHKRS